MEEVSLRAVLLGNRPGHHLLSSTPALLPLNATHTEELTLRVKGSKVLAFESCREDQLVKMSTLTLEKHTYCVAAVRQLTCMA